MLLAAMAVFVVCGAFAQRNYHGQASFQWGAKAGLNISKLTFTSGVNAASEEFVTKNNIDRCPLCGIALNEKGVCPKCGYKKQ